METNNSEVSNKYKSNGLLNSVIILDFTNTFEMVDHATLMNKMHYYVVSRKSVEWFESYLANR